MLVHCSTQGGGHAMGTARRSSRMVGLLLSISGIGVFTAPLSVLAQPTRPITQQIEMSIDELPGVVPTPEAEQLAGTYQRQPVFFRTTEPSGTIIVNTSERFLYLVQGNNR